MNNITPEDIKRWDKFVLKLTENECWSWLGYKTEKGYGQFGFQGKVIRAHVFAHEAFIGPLNGFLCLHSCDNPSCVNPKHLRQGTAKENTMEMVLKGRMNYGVTKGSENANSKLTEEKVRLIKEDLLTRTQNQVAIKYGVSQGCINNIKLGKTWRHVI